jgi:outer membrane immunogenic protein
MTQIWKLAIACAFAATAIPALAADLPAPAPLYKAASVAAPSYSWTGFYLGLNAGYGWGDRNFQLFNGDPAFYAPALAAGPIPATLAPNPQGFIGGGQAGYNIQSGLVVYGIEADIQYSNVKGTAATATSIIPFPNILTTAQQKLDWLGTLRGRLGVSNSDFLLYATGGLAYGHASASSSTLVTGPPGNSCANNLYCSVGAVSTTKAGWTAGMGAEYAFAQPWTVKLEYLYYSLGSATYNEPSSSVPTTGMQATAHFSGNLIRAGVNYKF